MRMGVYLLLLDHDELERPDGPLAGRGALSRRRWWPVRYDRRDLLDGDTSVPLGDAVHDLVETRTGRRPTGPVQTLTQLRTFGYVFNPLTVHYCLAPADGEWPRLEVVVLEVTNTPWHERHCYVIDARPGAGHGPHPGPVATGHLDRHGTLRAELPKQLHVSPFMGMDQTYHLSCTPPGPRLWLRLETYEPPTDSSTSVPVKVFDADLVLRREVLTRRSLAKRLVSHPLLTYRVSFGIHVHAGLLALKRVPFVRHPVRPDVDHPSKVDVAARGEGNGE